MKIAHLKLLLAMAFGAALIAPCQTGCAPRDTPHPVERDRFVEMDTNGDGKVVLEEFAQANPNMNEQAFIIIDKNSDKGIDRVEWLEFSQNHGRPPRREGAPMNNIPGDPLIPPPDSSDLPLMRPPLN